MKVDCYLNLNRDCVSVRSRESDDYGTVVSHQPKVHINSPEFVVQSAGREQVRDTGVRNVHAFVRGEWNEREKVLYGEPVTYNPYEYDQFVHPDTEKPVESAELCMVSTSGVLAKGLSFLDG